MATPSAQYSLTLRVEIGNQPGMLGKVAGAIGDAGGIIGAVDLVSVSPELLIRDITIDAAGPEDWDRITAAVDALHGARVIDAIDRTFLIHVGGKIEMHNRTAVKTRDESEAQFRTRGRCR